MNEDARFVFPNYGDYGYGIFLLDDKSRDYVLKNIQSEKDPFLRSMMWGSPVGQRPRSRAGSEGVCRAGDKESAGRSRTRRIVVLDPRPSLDGDELLHVGQTGGTACVAAAERGTERRRTIGDSSLRYRGVPPSVTARGRAHRPNAECSDAGAADHVLPGVFEYRVDGERRERCLKEMLSGNATVATSPVVPTEPGTPS